MSGEPHAGATAGEAPVRVLVVDDQELVREGIASLLGIQPGVTVVGSASDGRQAVELAVAEQPDVALVDVRMPGVDGIDTAAELAHRVPDCRVVMLTTFDDRDYVTRALRAGAVGYLLKNLPAAELARAGVAQVDAGVLTRLAAAAADGPGAPPPGGFPTPAPTPTAGSTPATTASATGATAAATATATATIAADPAAGAAPAPAVAHPLTDRETEVLRLVASGSSNREIARRLHLSEGTVKNHISRILARLGLRDRTQAALYARDHGLAPPSPAADPRTRSADHRTTRGG